MVPFSSQPLIHCTDVDIFTLRGEQTYYNILQACCLYCTAISPCIVLPACRDDVTKVNPIHVGKVKQAPPDHAMKLNGSCTHSNGISSRSSINLYIVHYHLHVRNAGDIKLSEEEQCFIGRKLLCY